MIYLTRKINQKKYSIHNEVKGRCLKNYSAKKIQEYLNTVNFPNYEEFNNIDDAYGNFHCKLFKVIDKIAPFKSSRIKNKTPEWFDLEISDKIKDRRKKFQKFKKSRLLRDKKLYVEMRNDIIQTIIRKKKNICERKT